MTYSTIPDHRSMVFDGQRNAAYFRALKKAIEPDFTVIDLGAGLGIHGLNAAVLGAAAVHLVEPSPVLEVARRVAADNELENVHCHPCRSEELELDERADILVSAFTGNFLLTEDLLPSLFLARDKYLKPGGKMIPDRARMEVVPVTAPDYYLECIGRWAAYPEHAGRHDEPPLDYSAARSFAVNSLYYDTRENFQATPLANPIALMEMDLTTATSADCDSQTELEMIRDGICHGWMGWFQMRLGDDWLSTSGEPDTTHWRPVFMPLDQPLQVRSGEQLRFALKRPEFGEWTWTTQYANGSQRQTTFLSQPLAPERMRKSSDNYQPRLGERGAAARWMLAQMTGEVPVGQLAIELQVQFPTLFTSEAEALRFSKDLAGRYS